jgi:hypothetical protein
MKRLSIILLIASLLTIAADFVPWTQMLELPRDLDDLYAKIEAQEYGYTWTPCETPPESPFVSWRQIVTIAEVNQDNGASRVILPQSAAQQILTGVTVSGDIDASEAEVFRLLLIEFLDGGFLSCGDADGYPVVHGPGVQRVIDAVTR